MDPADASALFKVLADDEVTEFYDDDTFTDVSGASDQIEALGKVSRSRDL